MCKLLRQKIFAVVTLRPSSVPEIVAILGADADEVRSALTGMDNAGLFLYEESTQEQSDEIDGDLRAYKLAACIPDDVWAECAALVDGYEAQLRLPGM